MEEAEQVRSTILSKHKAFVLEEGERGETDLVQFEITTGDVTPQKQAVRRMPFAVRREVALQLHRMQQSGVIQPSASPWASPIILVRKKDGSLRICVDYRKLNSVTKADTFPLPRIDDILDQLHQSKYFSSIDLASGYWQIRVHRDSQEKTAFIAPQGLFEFRVMPFGLRNAPAVFQRLMQRVLMGLNPAEGPDFVAAYLDDILVFSRTLEEHLLHLNQVIDRLTQAGLKLNPAFRAGRGRPSSHTQRTEAKQISYCRRQGVSCAWKRHGSAKIPRVVIILQTIHPRFCLPPTCLDPQGSDIPVDGGVSEAWTH